MTRAAKIVYLLAALIGLSGGAFLGFWNTRALLRIQYEVSRSTAPTLLSDFSFMQYRHAEIKHAESTLLSVAGLLERLEKSGPTKVQKLVLANTYTRLALLEDSTNDTQRSKESMLKARYWYTASGGVDHSDSEMKAALKRADEHLDRLGLQ
jgi:hypothetical protein